MRSRSAARSRQAPRCASQRKYVRDQRRGSRRAPGASARPRACVRTLRRDRDWSVSFGLRRRWPRKCVRDARADCRRATCSRAPRRHPFKISGASARPRVRSRSAARPHRGTKAARPPREGALSPVAGKRARSVTSALHHASVFERPHCSAAAVCRRRRRWRSARSAARVSAGRVRPTEARSPTRTRVATTGMPGSSAHAFDLSNAPDTSIRTGSMDNSSCDRSSRCCNATDSRSPSDRHGVSPLRG